MKRIITPGGIPEELFGKEIFRETQKIRVKVEKKRFGKLMTIIEGFDSSTDLNEIVKTLKKRLACGGTVKKGRILLQGDQREKAKRILVELGFSEEMIDVL